MNREAQILQALQGELPLAARKALVVELNSIRTRAAQRVATAREVELGKEAAAAHLTPAPTYVRHTSDTDWLGKVGSVRQAPAEIHQQAKSEAGAWMRQVSALARADHEELRIQAVGYAQVWGSQFGELATVARDSFLQTASHLAGVKLAADDEDEPKDDDEADDSDEAYTEAEDDSDGGNPFADDDSGEEDDGQSKKEGRRHATLASLRVTAARPLYEIARDIRRDWTSVNFGAQPYLDAMRELDSINDMYYSDTAKSIVAYFLSNASSWRGETAKAIKAELKAMMSGKSASKRTASLDDIQHESSRKVGYTNSYGLSDEGPNGLRKGMTVYVEGVDRATVLYVGFDEISNNMEDGPERVKQYPMYRDSFPVAIRYPDGLVGVVTFDALAPNSEEYWGKESSRRTAASPDYSSYPRGRAQGQEWSTTCSECGETETGTGYYNGWPSQGAFQRHLLCGPAPDLNYSDEYYDWMNRQGSRRHHMQASATRRTAEADGIDPPSPDSQNGYAESTLDDVSVPSAPEDTNMGWIAEGDPNAVTGSMGVYEAMFMGKQAGLYPDENAKGVTTWADGYGNWHATADSPEEARKAIERELADRGEIDPQNYEVEVKLVDGRHYVEAPPQRPEVVSSRKVAGPAHPSGTAFGWPRQGDNIICPKCGSDSVSFVGSNLGSDVVRGNNWTGIRCNSCATQSGAPLRLARDGGPSETLWDQQWGWKAASRSASRKHAEANGIDSPSPQSQNGYAETTLTDVSVGSAPDDTNLGWITDGDPNAEDEGSFDAPDNPIANEASRRTAGIVTIFDESEGRTIKEQIDFLSGVVGIDEAEEAIRKVVDANRLFCSVGGWAEINDVRYNWTRLDGGGSGPVKVKVGLESFASLRTAAEVTRFPDGHSEWKCNRCKAIVERWPGESDVSCVCGAEYNASGQQLRDDWRGNSSNWDDEVSDMDGYENQHAYDDRDYSTQSGWNSAYGSRKQRRTAGHGDLTPAMQADIDAAASALGVVGEDLRQGDWYDVWGTAMMWGFALNDYIVDRGGRANPTFQQAMGGSDTDSYEYQVLSGGGVSVAAAEKAERAIDALLDKAKAAGLDY